jgi:rod shape-determining protein MreD
MHRPRLRIYIIIFLLFFVELILFDKLRIHGVRPEILLIVTIFFGFHFGIARGVETGIISGILKDIFSIASFGVSAFSFMIVGFLSGYLKDKLLKENFVTQALFSCFSVYILWGIAIAWGQVLLSGIVPGINLSSLSFNTLVLYKGLYTAIMAPFLFFILTKTFNPKEA